MDIIGDSQSQISRLEIVESGRRRRFSDEAKLAIVAESYRGPQQVTVTARRHGITRWQLHSWRKAAREGRLGASLNGFVPARIVPDDWAPVEHSTPAAPAERTTQPSSRMEVVTANGRRVIVDRDVDVEALLRLMRGLETLR
jgi:transposase